MEEVKKIEEKKEKGATMIEYVLLAALISVVAVVAMQTVGRQASKIFSGTGGQLETAVGQAGF